MGRPASRSPRASVSDRPSVRRPRALAVAGSQAENPPAPSSVVSAPDRTVREVIPPWHVLKEKMDSKDRERAAKKNEITPPPPAPEALAALASLEAFVVEESPSSGVRMSEPGPVAAA